MSTFSEILFNFSQMSDEELARHLQEEENRAVAAHRTQPMYAQYPTTMVNRLRITILQVCSLCRTLHSEIEVLVGGAV